MQSSSFYNLMFIYVWIGLLLLERVVFSLYLTVEKGEIYHLCL